MTSEELARALVAHPRFNWRDGMCVSGMRVVDADESGVDVVRKGIVQELAHGVRRPDLADMATAGVLLGMLPMRQRAGGDDDGCWPHGRHWRVRFDGRLYAGATLGEAVAKALLACWGPA